MLLDVHCGRCGSRSHAVRGRVWHLVRARARPGVQRGIRGSAERGHAHDRRDRDTNGCQALE